MRNRKAIETTVGLDKHKLENYAGDARIQICILEALLDIRELLSKPTGKKKAS